MNKERKQDFDEESVNLEICYYTHLHLKDGFQM